MRKFKILEKGLVILMIFNMLSYGAFAADDTDPYVDGELSLSKCVQKGNTDFLLFLDTIIFMNGFFEGVVEPFKDIVMRNQCQSTDIMSLLNQSTKLRSAIRDAFLTCKNEKMPAMRKAFFSLIAEIYYVRHVVDGSIIISLPYDLVVVDPSSYLYPTSTLRAEMKEMYVRKAILTDDDFNKLFNQLETKYSERKLTYIVCDDSSWSVVVEKFNEFIDSLGGLAPAWKDFEKGVKGRAEKLVESVTDGGVEAWTTGKFQFNFNSMDSEVGFDDVTENIGDYIPVYSALNETKSPTIQTVLNAVGVVEDQLKLDEMRLKMETTYELLYKDISDESLSVLMLELDDLNQTVDDSFDILYFIRNCSRKINERQCPGKF